MATTSRNGMPPSSIQAISRLTGRLPAASGGYVPRYRSARNLCPRASARSSTCGGSSSVMVGLHGRRSMRAPPFAQVLQKIGRLAHSIWIQIARDIDGLQFARAVAVKFASALEHAHHFKLAENLKLCANVFFDLGFLSGHGFLQWLQHAFPCRVLWARART